MSYGINVHVENIRQGGTSGKRLIIENIHQNHIGLTEPAKTPERS